MIIVYTTIFGGSDSLKPAPKQPGVICCCFTDEPVEDQKGWDIFQCPRPENPRREAWRMRCVPHRLFDDYDRVIWIDASFTLTDLPRLLLDAGEAEIAALRHHRRKTVYEEGAEIIRIGQASAAGVNRQLNYYHERGFNLPHLSTSCILVRSNTVAVNQFNDRWAREIEGYSGDNTQLSLDYAAWVNGLEIKALQGSYRGTPYGIYDKVDHKQRRRPYDSHV